MRIENIPESYIANGNLNKNLFIYDLKMTETAIKTKVNLNMHMFSFLQVGKKQVHFLDTSVIVDNKQSILIPKGNCLWSELLDKENTYYCKLLFFSEQQLIDFLNKHVTKENSSKEIPSYFVIENDAYITAYLNSLTSISNSTLEFTENLLAVKFEELLLYLQSKYKDKFNNYLLSLVHKEKTSFKHNIEQNVYSSLSLEEIAFLCNMSLSTFKRHFIKEYNLSPGKWFREKRLLKAKTILEEGKLKASDIYLELGYSNLQNFSSAFKSRFGISPSSI
ncbi:AraC family transcriptional regulator [uncultured Tenacibaculum sp.]|uniref:helix-turn-helix domain-containing protein n=1 Tax=uncultured Tenacibaculum sp. TaxID=174713 RepID=UPI0026069D0A|nr:AraC family transcriptional regulator [uncultured Tenacibaculum sp.]